jgi:hypothetical protein
VDPSLLPGEGILPRRVALLQSFHLPILHHELINVVSELRSPEPETFERDERVGRLAWKCQRKTGARLIEHLKLNLARGQVSAREPGLLRVMGWRGFRGASPAKQKKTGSVTSSDGSLSAAKAQSLHFAL